MTSIKDEIVVALLEGGEAIGYDVCNAQELANAVLDRLKMLGLEIRARNDTHWHWHVPGDAWSMVRSED